MKEYNTSIHEETEYTPHELVRKIGQSPYQ